jgi:hypothetical protein
LDTGIFSNLWTDFDYARQVKCKNPTPAWNGDRASSILEMPRGKLFDAAYANGSMQCLGFKPVFV